MAKKIAIIGTSPSWEDAPFEDKSWDIWSFNRTGFKLPRWDVLFEIHNRFFMDGDAPYLEKLAKLQPPKVVVSLKRLVTDPEVNRVLEGKAREKFNRRHGKLWLSSSIAYAFASAIDACGPNDEIGLWGIDMESTEEYVTQFAACDHFRRIAWERGIEVTYPDGCMLFRDPEPYPERFETLEAIVYERKAVRCDKMIRDTEGKLEQTKQQMYRYLAVAEFMGDNEIAVDADGDSIKDIGDIAQAYARNAHQHEANLNMLRGELLATQHYRRLFCWNVLPPAFGDESVVDHLDVGPLE